MTARNARIRRPLHRGRTSSAAAAAAASASRWRSTSVANTVVEGWPVSLRAAHLTAVLPDGLHDVRQCGRRIVDGDTDVRRVDLVDLVHRGKPLEGRRGERCHRLDVDDVAADRQPAKLVGCRKGDQPTVGDQGDRVALLRLVDVLRRHQERPALVAQAVELFPDAGPEERVDPGRRFVEEQHRRVMDQRAGQLEPALHATRQGTGTPPADVPQVDQLQDLARTTMAGPPQDAEQRRHEVDVLARAQVRVEHERAGACTRSARASGA